MNQGLVCTFSADAMLVPKNELNSHTPDPDPKISPQSSQDQISEDREFINKGSRFMFLDNISKVAEPLLVLACAKAYAGGDWGLFKYYESLILMLVRLGSLGLDRGVIWIYSRCADESIFVQRFSRCINLVFLFSLAIFFFILLQQLGYLPVVGSWSAKLPHAPIGQLILYLASVPVQACTLLFLQTMLNKKVFHIGILTKNLIIPLAIYLPALIFAFTPFKTIGLALPYLFGNLVGLLLAGYGFLRYYKITWKDWAFSPSASKQLLRFSLPLASTDFFMSFAYRFDILLLGRYSGIMEVEIYSLIVMISNTLRSLRQSFDGIMLSVFSAGTSDGIDQGKRKNFNYASWMVTTIQMPFFFLSLFFGKQLLGLISPSYSAGYRVLALATFFNLLSTVGAFSGQILVGLGRTHIIPIAQIIFVLSSVLLNSLFVPHFGAEGAAFATGSAIVIGGLVTFAAVWIYAKSPILQWAYIKPIAEGFLIYSAVTGLHYIFPLGLLVDILLFAAATLVFGWQAHRYWKKFNVVLA
jgi:O-antigen/teichoic acid export membrane protein